MARRRGFTLIELLVVIAIIGILAAMLFPVFARARESARKIQCLSNVKNIAIAVQMYLTDYDALVPKEHRQEVLDFYQGVMDANGGDCDVGKQGACGNPYLRFPVVLDEYIKNRDVWRCPSARTEKSYPILNPYYGNVKGDWFLAAKAVYDAGCNVWMQCQRPLPPGWGGTITDSYDTQKWSCSAAGGGFQSSIGVPEDEYGLKTSQVNDPARYLAVGETGPGIDLWMTANLAYPDYCKVGCAGCAVVQPGCTPGTDYSSCVDWVNCSWTQNCGPGDGDKLKWARDANYRKQHARHLGGVNLGYWDGHAKWMASEAALFGAPDWRSFNPNPPDPTAQPIEGPVGICKLPL
jgi:prepilin-type N-terminal cleavage/methylation domain-containing protein/prepilin-type processing-associated H-X9-DG protein